MSRGELSHEIKIATDFNVANSMRCDNKVLAIKTRYTVVGIDEENYGFQIFALLTTTLKTGFVYIIV